MFAQHIVDKIPKEFSALVTTIPMSAPYQSKVPCHLKNVTVIDSRPPNSRSAGMYGDPYFDLLGPLLRNLGIGHVYVSTDSASSIADNAKSFSASGTVIILGGDTSVHEFVNALAPVTNLGTEIRLVVIPTGTGNALSISSGLPTPIDAVRRLFLSDSQDFVPLSTLPVRFPGRAESEHRVLVVASWGLHSALVADSDSQEMRAKFKEDPNERFKEAARINLNNILQRYKGEVLVSDNHDVYHHVYGPEHSYLLFSLMTYLEPNFLISPESQPPSDNIVHMVAIRPFDSLEVQSDRIMNIMMKAYDQGKHVKDPLVDYIPLKNKIRIEVDSRQDVQMRRWCLDGKVVISNPGIVELGTPTHFYNGWMLKILRGPR